MQITSIQLKNNMNTPPSFRANVKLSSTFAENYTKGKLEEVVKTIKGLGSFDDLVGLGLDQRYGQWLITGKGQINNKSMPEIFCADSSRHACLRKTLETLADRFQEAYGANYKNIDGVIEEDVPEVFQPIVNQGFQKTTKKQSEKTVEKVQENGISREVEALINKRIDEKFKDLIETKLESIVEKVVLRQLKTNKNVERDIQEIIKNSTEEVGQALSNLAKEYTNSSMNPEHPQRHLLGELHNRLSKLLELANDDYCGGY